MELFWNPFAVLWLVPAVANLGLAALVLRTRPDRFQNRALALLLFFGGLYAGWAAVSFSFADAPSAFAAHILVLVCWFLLFAAYVPLVATLGTPFARPLRPRWVHGLAFAAMGALAITIVVRPSLFVSGVVRPPPPFDTPQPVYASGALTTVVPLAVLAFLLFAVACAVSAYRRAPQGSAARTRAKMFALAFGAHDTAQASALAAAALGAYRAEPFAVGPLLLGVLLAYGILRHQLFDIDLKIKFAVRRGTVVGAFVAAFFVASELASSVLSEQFGLFAGVLAAGLLVFLLAPLQRAADKLADRALPHVQDTAEYRLVRKREVYRAALEGALQDGIVTDKERDILARLQDELGLSATEARALEREATRTRPSLPQGA